MSEPHDREPPALPDLPTEVKVQAGIAIGLGVIGIGAAVWGIAGMMWSMYELSQASPTPAGVPGAAGLQASARTLMMVSLPVAAVGNLTSLVLSLAALASGGILLMSRRLMPLAWTALACVVYLVIFHVVWPVIDGVLTWWFMSDAMNQALGSTGSQSTGLDVGMIVAASTGVGVLCGLFISAVRIGFWGWTWVTVRRLARTIADPRDAVLDME